MSLLADIRDHDRMKDPIDKSEWSGNCWSNHHSKCSGKKGHPGHYTDCGCPCHKN